MIEQIKYINHMNEVIEFGKDGIFINYNTLRDYSWDITSANNKIASFKKGIVSKTIPVIIKCHNEEEGIEIRNRLFEVFEKDVLAKKNGRIVIGEYYLKCFITGSKKTKYLINNGYMHLSLTMKSDYPAWIKESYTIFRPKTALNTSETAEGREILIGNATNSILTNYGVYGKSTQQTYSGKNLLENTATSQTIRGIDFVVNDDGSVTGSGTATGTANLYINTDIKIPSDTYIMNGCISDVSNVFHTAQLSCEDGSKKWYGEHGQGVSFTVDDTVTNVTMYIEIREGVTLNNATFYPMIRKASITDATYEPYVGGEASPNPSYPQDIESVGDVVNLISRLEGTGTLISGLSITHNEDKTVTLDGAYSPPSMSGGTTPKETTYTIAVVDAEAGDYILESGVYLPSGLTMYASCEDGTKEEIASGKRTAVIHCTSKIVSIGITAQRGASFDNLTLYPKLYRGLGVNTNNKNLLENTKGTLTTNGVTFTENSDGSITATGTSKSDFTDYYINGSWGGTDNILPIESGSLIAKGTGTSNIFQYIIKNSAVMAYSNHGADVPIDVTEGGINAVMYRIPNGATVDHTFYPMIRKASIEDDSYVPHQSTKALIPITDSLRGIKVSEGGNFTDETGQQWVCDTLEKYADGSGKLVQRVYHKVFDGTESFSADANGTKGGIRFAYADSKVKRNANNASVTGAICNKLTEQTPNYSWGENNDCFAISIVNHIMFRLARCTNVTDVATLQAQLKAWYDAGEPLEFICELAEPIETPLTAEQIAEIEKLQTFEGITYITNNGYAYQEVTYSIKQYLDFPYGYEYDFTADFDSDVLLNTSFVPVDFRMVIHGAITNPSVFISGHEYSVDVVLDEGDYLTIDSQAKTIVLSKRDGTQVNCFNHRNRDSYVFEKIPSGKNEITSAGDLNMDIVLLDERSEPRWT